MHAPKFWDAGHRALPAVLSPLALCYTLAGRWRRQLTLPHDPGVPVVCVGNLVAGGAGKTPTALAIGAWLKSQGRAVHYLTRGYGGRLKGPVRVQPHRHDVRAVGDEALLLAASAATWVARDRTAGADAAVADGADILVMDDGYQNPTLRKHLSILVFDAGVMLGNGHVLPAGPLREPPMDGLARADAIVVIDDPGRAPPVDGQLPGPGACFRARFAPTPEGYRLADAPIVAFAGIARPEKFFATLQGIGGHLLACHLYADHHVFTEDEIMALIEEAHAKGARLVTTTKDAVRLPFEVRRMVEVFAVDLEFDAANALDELLGPLLARE